MPDTMTMLPWSNIAGLNEPTLIIAALLYLIAGWRTWQVVMLTSRSDDPAAQAYASGTFPFITMATFAVLWLPILVCTTAIALCERIIGRRPNHG